MHSRFVSINIVLARKKKMIRLNRHGLEEMSAYKQLQPSSNTKEVDITDDVQDAEFSDTETDLRRYGFKESVEEIIQNLVTEFYVNGAGSMLKLMEKSTNLDLVLFTLRGMEIYLYEKKENSLNSFGMLMLNKIQNHNISDIYRERATRLASNIQDHSELYSLLCSTFQLTRNEETQEEEEEGIETVQREQEEYSQICPVPTFDIYSLLSKSLLSQYQDNIDKRNSFLKTKQDEINSRNIQILQLSQDLEIEKDKQTMYNNRIQILKQHLSIMEKELENSVTNEQSISNQLPQLLQDQQDELLFHNKFKQIHNQDQLYLQELQIAYKTIHN